MPSPSNSSGHYSRLLKLGITAAELAGSYAVGLTRLALSDKSRRGQLLKELHERNALSLAEHSGRLRGPFVKVVQLLSGQHGLMPIEYLEALSQLQDGVPPVDYETLVPLLRREFHKDPRELFAEFDPEPLASASLGHVHRGQTHDGAEVAVKIQYPGIDDAVVSDLEYLRGALLLLGLAVRVTGTEAPDYTPLHREISKLIAEEIDYVREADNLERFGRIYESFPKTAVPRVYRELSTRRVLTMELMNGQRIREFAASNASREARVAVIMTLWQMFLHEALVHGVIHGDSHPGNFLVTPDGRVVLLDFGCVKELPLNQRRGLVEFILGGMDGSLSRMVEGFKLMGYARNAEQAAPYLALTMMFLGGVTSSKLTESVVQERDLVHAIREHELYRN